MAYTYQNVFNAMEILHPELHTQTGEGDVTKATRAVQIAVWQFEDLLAQQENFLGDATGTISTAATTETTTFPSGVLRLNRLQYVDASTSPRPTWDLIDIRRTGGHILTPGWPYNVMNFVTATGGGGKPVAYYTDGAKIYWVPLPDAVYTVRWYGFQRQADITDGTTSFTFDQSVILPLATFAVKLIRLGLDDDVTNYTELAQETFRSVLETLGHWKREQAPEPQYRYRHIS